MRLLNLDAIDYSTILEHVLQIPEVTVSSDNELFKGKGVCDWLHYAPSLVHTLFRSDVFDIPVGFLGFTVINLIPYLDRGTGGKDGGV